jgi:uncharacterized OB-fold protein
MEQVLDFKSYNNALKKNRLLGLTCKECGTVTCPPKMVCQECAGTDLEVVELSGMGKIVTFTTTYVAAEGKEAEAPYTIAMIELDEGAWIAGNLIDIDPSEATMDLIGKRVKLGHKVFPGDRFSGGESARPLFSFVK